ncbi:MAG: transposase [Syntrophomonadaceae bacterium]|nr:transposase [Syntrophomonadaceae bacterium]MDD3022821.1 transposase [Syntrophomonadaceae bacterium]
MPRQARQSSKTAIYHLLVRGINRGAIFHNDQDRQRYLDTLARIAEDSNALILGYCLMDNHVHILLKEGVKKISNIMHRLGASYAYYYNSKYERVGHVFQNRFKSENIEDDIYLKTVIRYIHQNPVKAGMVKRAEEYRWSSCRGYYGGKGLSGISNTGLILGMFSEKEEQAIKALQQFTEAENEDKFLEDMEATALSDSQAREVIETVLNNKPVKILHEMSKADRDMVLHKLKEIEGLSIRQISRLTGESFNIVKRA